jgi:hypothetical protein
MPNNHVLLEKITVGAAGAASVTFANIPQTGYTDLVVKASARTSRAAVEDGLGMYFNSDSSNYEWRTIFGSGSSVTSTNRVSGGYGTTWVARVNGNNSTSSTFASVDIYIPNYTSSNQKSYSVDSATENNATEAYAHLSAILFSNTAAISSITLLGGNANLAANSTFYLYGVAKLGTTPAIAPKAAGGDIVMTDGTYWYHTFLSSGTFTPALNMSCDYLVVAGGGGGGLNHGGGGGAGGLRSTVGATGGGGALESALAVSPNTSYTVTVGAGGTGGTGSANATNGSNSVFSTITSTGGGRGTNNDGAGASGGSGGGSANLSTAGGAGTANQGYAGGAGSPGDGLSRHGGGGGGANAVGTAGTNSQAGAGGNGVATNISGSSVTYAGGGGGGGYTGTNAAGGSGGGGSGKSGTGATAGDSGTANRGAGGGAGSAGSGLGGAGGSGIVIIRYPVAS